MKEKMNQGIQKIGKYAKYVAILLIVAFMMFIVQSKNQFSEYVPFHIPVKLEERGKVKLGDGDVITQKFTASADTIEEVQIFVDCNQEVTRPGSMELTITDQKGKEIFHLTPTLDKVDGNEIDSAPLGKKVQKEHHWYNVMVNQKVKKGETYTYTIKGIGISDKNPLYIYTAKDKGDIFGQCTVNGKKVSSRLYIKSWATRIDKMAIGLALAICIVLIGLILLPISIPPKMNRIVSWIYFAIVPWIAFYMVEKTFYNPISQMNKWAFGLNVLWYYAVFGILLFIFNRINTAVIVGSILLYICGIAEYLTLMYRGTPITPSDFYSLGTAMDVADHYTLDLNRAAIIATVVMIGICILAWKLTTFKVSKGKKQRLIVLAIAVVILGGTIFTTSRTQFLSNRKVGVNLWNQKKGYKRNGFVLSFFMNIQYVMGAKPDGYSEAKVESITKNNKVTTGKKTSLKQKPNVVVIMNETLADLSVVNDIKTNKEVFPYLNSLKENTIKGHMLMSVFGGGTSNSEYEFLTGNSVGSLPLSGNAYTQYIKSETSSLASQLKEQGYDTVAFHPYKASGWNREKVYPLLGFDDFLTIDDMSASAQKYRGWYSDNADYDKIIEIFEKKKKNQPLFFFNVTIQNHGGYDVADKNFNEQIKITDEKKTETADRYESLMYESDQAFKKIVNYFSKQSEPTIVVLFGDHQPKLEDEFYELLYGKALDSLSLKELQKKYTVPFVIWANYDIDEKQDVYTSANYLSSMMLEQTNLKLTPYNQYLLDLAKKLPAINANGYVDAKGENHTLRAKTEYSKLVNEYQILQYNNLFDNKNRDTSLFSTK
ncbi:MAG: LTA synthase family protein [Anaerostipes sp.]|jgi:phosphoglycerol transferase MdoB-like AlkP superfamily enzyme